MFLFFRKESLNSIFAQIVFIFSLIYTSVSIFSYSLFNSKIPSFFGIPRFNPHLTYGDLRSPTHSSGCGLDMSLMRTIQDNCDPWNRPANFPKFLLNIYRSFGVDSSSTDLIGALFGFIFIIGIIFFIFKYIDNKILKYWISSICILCWPSQLVIERGNFDSIVFIWCLILLDLVSSYLIKRKNKYIFLIPIFTFLPVSIKFFPILGILPLCFINIFIFRKERSLFYIILLTSIFAIIFQISDLKNALLTVKDYSFATGIQTFGFLSLYQDIHLKSTTIIFIFLKIFLIVGTSINTYWGFLKKLKSPKNNFILINFANTQIGLFFMLNITLTYFAFSNYDYRMIFAIGMIPFFISIWEYIPKKIFKISKKLIPYFFIFIGFQKYLITNLDTTSSYISDILIQPYLIGFTIGIISFLIFNKKIKFIS